MSAGLIVAVIIALVVGREFGWHEGYSIGVRDGKYIERRDAKYREASE